MKLWVPPWKCPPPPNQTILARYGAALCFVAYSRALDCWKHIANGTEEKIEPPPLWFCDADWFHTHQIKGATAPVALDRPVVKMRRSKKPAQLKLI